MSEQEWLSCDDPAAMLDYLVLTDGSTRINDRMLRLFACACCRRIWDKLTDARSREVVETVEQFADGAVSMTELEGSGKSARGAVMEAGAAGWDAWEEYTNRNIAWAVHWADPYEAARGVVEYSSRCADWDAVRRPQVHILQDIVGNPFQTWTVQPQWKTPSVRQLAQTIYETRQFATMPILADALEEAGCDREEILLHCRSGEQHYRGCWLVDLLLWENRKT